MAGFFGKIFGGGYKSPYSTTAPNQTTWDPTTFRPTGPGSERVVRGPYALDYQNTANQMAEAARARYYRQSQGFLSGANKMFQSYRPGGAATLASGIYSQQAQLAYNIGSNQQAPDLLMGYREDERKQAESEAKKAWRQAFAMTALVHPLSKFGAPGQQPGTPPANTPGQGGGAPLGGGGAPGGGVAGTGMGGVMTGMGTAGGALGSGAGGMGGVMEGMGQMGAQVAPEVGAMGSGGGAAAAGGAAAIPIVGAAVGIGKAIGDNQVGMVANQPTHQADLANDKRSGPAGAGGKGPIGGAGGPTLSYGDDGDFSPMAAAASAVRGNPLAGEAAKRVLAEFHDDSWIQDMNSYLSKNLKSDLQTSGLIDKPYGSNSNTGGKQSDHIPSSTALLGYGVDDYVGAK